MSFTQKSSLFVVLKKFTFLELGYTIPDAFNPVSDSDLLWSLIKLVSLAFS